MTALSRLWPFWFLLCASGCSKSTASWVEQAKDPDPAKRLHAIHALRERVNDKEVVVPVLTEALKDDDTYVRRDAARALGKFGPDARAAVPALVARLEDREPSVRKAAAQALKRIAPAAATEAGVR